MGTIGRVKKQSDVFCMETSSVICRGLNDLVHEQMFA